MAEVKTYKCDICGKVYHVDDNAEYREMDLADRTFLNYGAVDVKHYEHICEECAGEIRKVIEDPKAFDRLYCEKDKLSEYLRKIIELFPFHVYASPFGNCENDCERIAYGVGRLSQDIEDFQKRLLKANESCNKWKAVALWVTGTLAAVLIGMVVSLFV